MVLGKRVLTAGAVIEIGATSVTNGRCSDTVAIEQLVRYMDDGWMFDAEGLWEALKRIPPESATEEKFLEAFFRTHTARLQRLLPVLRREPRGGALSKFADQIVELVEAGKVIPLVRVS